MTDDLVERLKPRWAVDEPASRIVNVLRNLEQFGCADDLNKWIVANNALKSEAADATLKLQGEVAEARDAFKALISAMAQEGMGVGENADGSIRIKNNTAEAAGAEVAGMREALEWYAEQVAGCRKITSEGNDARHALDADGGKRARAALQPGERT